MPEGPFDCRTCQSAPQLQTRLGCFTDTEEVLVEVATHSLKRCPISYRVPGALRLVEMEHEGALTAQYESRVNWPPKRIAGLYHVKYLNDCKETQK